MDWRRIDVYYYDPDKDRLILEGVRPLLRRLAGRVDGAWFTRHWRRGPHLRLLVSTGAATFDEVVRPAADEIIGGFLARHPSTHVLDPERERAAHQRLAELEHEQGPLWPWFPDNSLRVSAHEPREAQLGGPAAAELLADFYAGTNELAFRMIEQVSGRSRLALAFNLMITTAHALSNSDITSGFVSFRSHAEAFLHVFPEADGLRPRWDRHYRAHAPVLRRRVGAVTAALDGGAPGVPFVEDWVRALAPYRISGAELIRSGAVALPADRATTAAELPDVSAFHRRLYTNPRWAQTRASVDFQVYRLMLNLTYLHLTRLGITPVERFLLCHLAANAVEEEHGIRAIDLVGPPPDPRAEAVR
ncbi:thiopeptide maturation pyridine synthase [Dactylosporangium sp. NPDC051541]|uniref:thiopeptide maturation pyridine synthase n=1 Tax=Dactylosporangium sp. NPDC051541 TaxID=3363977 RepID=UPI00379C32FC